MLWKRRHDARYQPASDGLDDSAWTLVCDYVRVTARRDVKALSRLVADRPVPQWQHKVAVLYALFALARHLESIVGIKPTEEEIHAIAARIHAGMIGTTTFPLTRVEDTIRQLYGLAPTQSPTTENTFLLATAALGSLMPEPDEQLHAVRALVAVDAASETELILRAASK